MSNNAQKTGNRVVLLRGRVDRQMDGWDEQPLDSTSVFIQLEPEAIDDIMAEIDEVIEEHRLATREMRFLDGGLELRFRRRQDAVTFRTAVRRTPSIRVPGD